MSGCSLDTVVDRLGAIAPLRLAESWDNVGLLAHPTRARRIRRVLLTIDLTDAVLDEAERQGAEMIVAYHPPLFHQTRRLTPDDPSMRRMVRCVEKRIAIYSPHTALDAVTGGVNDWLAEGLGPAAECRPIQPAAMDDDPCKLVVFVPVDDADRLCAALSKQAAAGVIGHYSDCSFRLRGTGTFRGDESTNPAVGQRGRLEQVEEIRLEMVCPAGCLGRAEQVIRAEHPYEEPAWDVYPLRPSTSCDAGAGRRVQLSKSVKLRTVVDRVKRWLKLDHVRVAVGDGRSLQSAVASVALCPGAGGSVLKGQPADLYLTGELRHHDILAANAAGTSVILTDHTQCERGYLPRLAERLRKELDQGVTIHISRCDREPLRII
jgi:dinuclear metal center YbgI/SA1388 family protein